MGRGVLRIWPVSALGAQKQILTNVYLIKSAKTVEKNVCVRVNLQNAVRKKRVSTTI